MKRVIQKILARCGFLSPATVQVIQVGEPTEWTPSDAQQWKAFLATSAGQSLFKKARAMEVATCVNACSGKYDPKMASGISFTLNWLEKLTTISSASDAKDATIEDSLHDNAETLAPELSYV